MLTALASVINLTAVSVERCVLHPLLSVSVTREFLTFTQ